MLPLFALLFVVCLPAAFFHKMDTSSGLSSIASLSLGFTMSMRAGGMAFTANRPGGPLTAAFPTSAWTVKPPSSPSAVQLTTGSSGTSPLPLRGAAGDQAGENGSSRSAVESCRSLVVPCVSLVSAPLASNDRPLDAGGSHPPPRHPVSPIAELPEDVDSSSSSSTDGGEQQLTITTISNDGDSSPPVIALSNVVVDCQTIADGPTLHAPPTQADIAASEDEAVVEIGETLPSVIPGCRRTSGPLPGDVVDKLETRRTSVADSDGSSVQCRDHEESVRPAMPSETNSRGQVLDDVIVVVENDANGDVVGTFFTPSIAADSFAEAVSPPSESEPIAGLVCNTDSPAGQVSDASAEVADRTSCKRPDSTSSTAAPLLNNGADSSAVGWTPTTRFGLAASPRAESSASAAATSVWRKNPLTRLVRHRKDTVSRVIRHRL